MNHGYGVLSTEAESRLVSRSDLLEKKKNPEWEGYVDIFRLSCEIENHQISILSRSSVESFLATE